MSPLLRPLNEPRDIALSAEVAQDGIALIIGKRVRDIRVSQDIVKTRDVRVLMSWSGRGRV